MVFWVINTTPNPHAIPWPCPSHTMPPTPMHATVLSCQKR